MECYKSRSQRIAIGTIRLGDGRPCLFAPANLKTLALTLDYGTKLESFACLDCGLVWLATSPTELAEYVRKHCKPKPDNTGD